MLRAIIGITVLIVTPTIHAEILPSFGLSHAAKAAANIIVVEEGKIVEVWVGDLKVGEAFSAMPPASAGKVFYGFAGQTDAEIDEDLASKGLKRVAAVTGKRTIHFVPPAAAVGSPGRLMARDRAYRDVWSEQGQVYAIVQFINPGPNRMTSLDMTEAALKQAVLDVRAIDAKVQAVSKEPDRAQRAADLLALLQPGARLANDEVEQAIRECGRAAWPAIEAVLFGDEHLPLHAELIHLARGLARRELLAAAPRIVAAEQAYFEQLDSAGKPYDRQKPPHVYHEHRRSAAQWAIDSK